jgi:hypothetical protein
MIYKEGISTTKADWGGIVYPIRLLCGTETKLIGKCSLGTILRSFGRIIDITEREKVVLRNPGGYRRKWRSRSRMDRILRGHKLIRSV